MSYSEPLPTGFQRRRVNGDFVDTVYWARDGIGPPMVFIHGNSASKAAFRDLLVSAPLAGLALFAIDLPGAGESDQAPDVQYTIPALARNVRHILPAISPEPPIVVGWSLGGHIALEVVGQDPCAARGLVLTGTPPAGPGPEEVFSSFRPSELMAVTTGESPPPELLDQYVQALYGASRVIPPELYAAARRFHGRMRRIFAEHWLSATDGFPQRSLIAHWPGPIAVIQGEDEPFFDPALIDRLKWRRLWRGQSQMLGGCGHAPFYEQPERYARLLADFRHDLCA